MKAITNEMVQIYHLKELGYDFMGYTFKREGDLSYHHLIIPRRYGGKETINNGAILVQKTSHDYLHIIERYDPDLFKAITNQLVDENIMRKIEYANLKKIHDMLLYFEQWHDRDTTKNGQKVIKQEYITTRVPILTRDRKKR